MRFAVVAALLSLSTTAHAAKWPKELNGEYCWQGLGCEPLTVNLGRNGEFDAAGYGGGYHGHWTYDAQTSHLELVFDVGTVYTGARNGTCFEGLKQDYLGSSGTWWACL